MAVGRFRVRVWEGEEGKLRRASIGGGERRRGGRWRESVCMTVYVSELFGAFCFGLSYPEEEGEEESVVVWNKRQ